MIAEELQKIVAQEEEEQRGSSITIFVCSGTACLSAHSDQIQLRWKKKPKHVVSVMYALLLAVAVAGYAPAGRWFRLSQQGFVSGC